jgi:biotin carboxyl carrier protein
VVGEEGVAPMKFSAMVGDTVHEINVERQDGIYIVEVEGVRKEVDALKLEGDFYSFLIEGKSYEVSVEPDGDGYHVRHGAASKVVRFADPSRGARDGFGATKGPENVTSVMPGKVVRVLVAEGDEVGAGQGLVVVEAMKMENEVASPKEGTVSSVKVEPGQAVETGAVLVVVE